MRIGIIGNYGATNIGDEAILSAILGAYPAHEFTVFSAAPGVAAEQFKATSAPLFPLGFRSFFRYGFWGSIKALRKVEAVILGGGGLFQDDRLYASFLWAWQCAWVKWLKKPLFVYAIGVGPLKTRLGRALTRWALKHADVITVRDEASRKLLQEIGLTEGEIHVTADPAFLLKPLHKTAERSKGLYLISLRPWGDDQRLLKTMTEWLLELKEKKHARFQFVSMQQIREHDQGILNTLAERVSGEVVAPADFQELLALTQRAEFAIGMRFHFLIGALLTETPVIPISYSPKVDALFLGTPLERYMIPLQELTAARLTDCLRHLSVDYNNVKIYEKERIENLGQKAHHNIVLLNQWVEDLG